MSNPAEQRPALRHAPPSPHAASAVRRASSHAGEHHERPERAPFTRAQLVTLIAFIVCALGLLAAVAEVAHAQFSKGQAFSFADRAAPTAPELYVSRGGTDVRELPDAQPIAAGPQLAGFSR